LASPLSPSPNISLPRTTAPNMLLPGTANSIFSQPANHCVRHNVSNTPTLLILLFPHKQQLE
jgi:hypothetical protein